MNGYVIRVIEFGFDWNTIGNIRSRNVEKRSELQTSLSINLTSCEIWHLP